MAIFAAIPQDTTNADDPPTTTPPLLPTSQQVPPADPTHALGPYDVINAPNLQQLPGNLFFHRIIRAINRVLYRASTLLQHVIQAVISKIHSHGGQFYYVQSRDETTRRPTSIAIMSEQKTRRYVAKRCTDDAKNRRHLDHPDNLAVF